MNSGITGEAARFDLIVIGAGINGAGIARDAALRSLRVLLVDKGDIASGTTSWSSRLIHGGLRYLEHREFGLVRESLLERERLPEIAPHLVQPLPLLIPIYEGDTRGPLLIRAGMVAYDALSFGKSLPAHRMLNSKRFAGVSRDSRARTAWCGPSIQCPGRVLRTVGPGKPPSAPGDGAEYPDFPEVKRILPRTALPGI